MLRQQDHLEKMSSYLYGRLRLYKYIPSVIEPSTVNKSNPQTLVSQMADADDANQHLGNRVLKKALGY